MHVRLKGLYKQQSAARSTSRCRDPSTLLLNTVLIGHLTISSSIHITPSPFNASIPRLYISNNDAKVTVCALGRQEWDTRNLVVEETIDLGTAVNHCQFMFNLAADPNFF
jgi:hypothetical protein